MSTGTGSPSTTTSTPRADASGVAGAARAWVGLLLRIAARGWRAFLLTLLAAALLPAAFGWHGYVVRSGSMEPGIDVGDVVVGAPLGADDTIRPGRIFLFDDPVPHPGRHRTLVHRVVRRNDDGSFTTAGDANAGDDSTPVRRPAFHDRAVLLVPLIGRPLRWAEQRQFVPLAGWGGVTAAAFALAPRPRRSTRPDQDRPRRRRRRPDRRPRRAAAPKPATSRAGIVRRLVPLVGLAVIAAVGRPGDAAFQSATRNPGNQWTVATTLGSYDDILLADAPYLLYALDEGAGSTAVDSSGGHHDGSYAAVSAYHQPGALTRSPGYSITLGGLGQLITGGPALTDPTTFSLELWFKTTTTAGGKLIGFESTRGLLSPVFDRHVFMRPDGRLVYGGWSNPNSSAITTALPYNDGAWHHLVLTARPHGALQDATIYVDGAAVVAGTTTKTSAYGGWWRIGYGSLPVGAGYPSSGSFAGSIDDVAIYPTELSAARVAAHYAAR